ncbi:MAG: CRTAC1 family protein [Planctomycetota bacterium]|nr:MAG: CRTAC1 family protein [Planctomycetota bacterium]
MPLLPLCPRPPQRPAEGSARQRSGGRTARTAARAGALAAVAATLLAAGTPARAQEDAPSPGPWFVEVGRARGLPDGFHNRNLFCDLDGDRWPDAVLDNRWVLWNRPAPGGGRRFVLASPALGLVPEGAPRPDLLLFADLDDDGDRDAFVGYAGDPGNPKWVDHGRRSHVALLDDGRYRPLASPELAQVETLVAGAFVDVDRDGRLDLVRGSHYVSGGLDYEAYPLRLDRGLGDGRFRDATAAAGLALRREPGALDSRRPVYGVSVCDWNNDGWPDLLVCAYGRQRNLLFANRGDGTFVDVGVATGFAGDADRSGVYPPATKEFFRRRFGQARPDEPPFRANGNTFDAPAADFDNDGDLDVFLGEITHAWAGPSSDRSQLLVNQGPPDFRFVRREVTPRVHRVPNWNQGDLYAGWLDADNDGWLDLLLASGEYPDDQRLRLYRQDPPGTFREVTALAGLDWEMCTQLSLADYDRDGDVDVLVGTSNNRLPPERRQGRVLRTALFENRVGQRNHWLNVRLEGLGAARGGANRDALGARVVVVAGGLRQLREVVGARGHAGHNDALEAAFGLGRCARVDRLEVHWPGPTKRVSVFRDVEADRFLLVREGAPRFEVLGPF